MCVHKMLSILRCTLRENGVFAESSLREYTRVWKAFCAYVCRVSMVQYECVRFAEGEWRIRRIIP